MGNQKNRYLFFKGFLKNRNGAKSGVTSFYYLFANKRYLFSFIVKK